MENKINKKIHHWSSSFKDYLKEEINKLNVSQEVANELVNKIYDYEVCSLTKEDFVKRKRTKNIIADCERCIAKKSNELQCTRKKKSGEEYCGTHLKGLPHGVVDLSLPASSSKKIEIWSQDIQGIIYYIDSDMNIYSPEDILRNSKNPRVIATYKKENDIYSIVSFH